MAIIGCFSILGGKKKKSKGEKDSTYNKDTLLLKLKLVKSPDRKILNSSAFTTSESFGNEEKSEVMSYGNIVAAETAEVAYEGSDEGCENLSVNRGVSDFSFRSELVNREENEELLMSKSLGSYKTTDEMDDQLGNESENGTKVGDPLIQSGYVSDPGFSQTKIWDAPILKRSCSNLEKSDVLKKIANQLHSSKSRSSEDLQNLAEAVTGFPGSPVSVMTNYSADKIILKKHSSSQVLPSRSRKLWWKLFLWSHRNLHQPLALTTQQPVIESNQRGGYCSDTLEPSRLSESSKLQSPVSITEESRNDNKFEKWGNFSGFWPQNQWVAFPAESSSSLTRVGEWVNNLEIESPLLPSDAEENDDENIVFPPSPDNGETPAGQITPMNYKLSNVNISEEVLHANSVIQSLNSSSTIAHIFDMSLKVIPSMSHFASLRALNLSGNFIVRIIPGSLPKGLHTLNLSRNKIVTLEGLRELIRLRVLDLSYNRISRLGHGLSNCTLIKELYLAGNKISDVEGLHRLLKLTVLDLSFNKVSTAKALAQLVANYNSLRALNILGNPIQRNIGDDQLRKVISGILPELSYLNKQSIKSQRTREATTDSLAKAARGNNERTSRRKHSKRVIRGSSASTVRQMSKVSTGHKSKNQLKGSKDLLSSLLTLKSTAVASSSN